MVIESPAKTSQPRHGGVFAGHTGKLVCQRKLGPVARFWCAYHGIIGLSAISMEPKKDVLADYLRKGFDFYASAKYQEALEMFNNVLEIDSKNILALAGRGTSLMKLGNHREAIGMYDKVLEIDPKNIELLLSKGDILLFDLSQPQEAVEMYDEILRIEEKNVNALNRKAVVLMLNNPRKAIEMYNKVLEIDPSNEIALFNRNSTVQNALADYYKKGLKFFNSGQYQEAIESYDKMLEIDSNHTPALVNKGLCLGLLHKYREEIEMWNKVLGTDPNHKLALSSIIVAQQMLGEPL